MVEVSPPTCKAGFPTMVPFLDSLRVELAGRALACCTIVESGKGTSLDRAVRVTVELDPCVTEGARVQVSVQDQANGWAMHREVALDDVAASARPRALALAVAELIRSIEQTPPPEPLWPTPRAVEPVPTSVHHTPTSLQLQGELRALPTRDTTIWGGRMQLSVPWHHLHVDIDLGGGFASAHDDLGDVLLRSASVGMGLGPRFASRTVTLDLGLRAEMGWTWIRGESQRAGVRTQSGSAWTSCAGLRGAIQVPAALWVRPSLALEGGFVLHGVKGESSNQPVVGMTGYYLLAALGLAVSL